MIVMTGENVNESRTFMSMKEENQLIRFGMAEKMRRANKKEVQKLTFKDEQMCLVPLSDVVWLNIFSFCGSEEILKMLTQYPELYKYFPVEKFKRDVLFPEFLKLDYFGKMPFNKEDPYLDLAVCRAISKKIRAEVDATIPVVIDEIIEGSFKAAAVFPDFYGFYIKDRMRLKDVCFHFLDSKLPTLWYPRSVDFMISDPNPRENEPANDGTNGLKIGLLGQEKQEEILKEFCKDASTFIEAKGHQLLRFSLEADQLKFWSRAFINEAQVYSLLNSWVSKMPHLKWLRFGISDYTIDSSAKGPTIGNVRSKINEEPFPTISSLRRITFVCEIHETSSFAIHEEVLKRNSHIKVFELEIEEITDRFVSHFPVEMVYNLNLEAFVISNANHFDLDFNSLNHLMNSAWPLRVLDLSISCMGVYFPRLIKVINNYKTLEHVRLRRLEVEITDSSQFGYLEPTLLKEFHISFSPHFDFSDDLFFFLHARFLQKCKRLETLYWAMKKVNKPHMERIFRRDSTNPYLMNFYAGIYDLDQSNVWDFFPYLKEIVVKVEFDYDDPISKTYSRKTM